MEIYPAIDLLEGKVVRLEQGRYQKPIVYSEDPVVIAKAWVDEGARWLHVVDLDGARSGEIKNWDSVERIFSAVKASIQFGGGVRKISDIDRLVQLGAQRVILGTKALDQDFLKSASKTYGCKLALGIDVKGEEVQVEGWLKGTKKSVFELFREIANHQIGCAIITDIEKDGTLSGLNVTKLRPLLEQAPCPVILSGGIRSLEDIRALVCMEEQVGCAGLNGAIIGKALYEGRINLGAALRLARREAK